MNKKADKQKPEMLSRNTFLVFVAAVAQYKTYKDKNEGKPGYDGKHFPGLDPAEIRATTAQWKRGRSLHTPEVLGHLKRLLDTRFLRHHPNKERLGWDKPYECLAISEEGEALYDRLDTMKIDGIVPAEHICHKASEDYWHALIVSSLLAHPTPIRDEDIVRQTSLSPSAVAAGRRLAKEGFELATGATFKAVLLMDKPEDGPWSYCLHPDQWTAGGDDLDGVVGAMLDALPADAPDPEPTTTPAPETGAQTVTVPPSEAQVKKSKGTTGKRYYLLTLEIPEAEIKLFKKAATATGYKTVEGFMEMKVSAVARGLRSEVKTALEEKKAELRQEIARVDASLAEL